VSGLSVWHVGDLRRPTRTWQRLQAFERLGHRVTPFSYYPETASPDDPCATGLRHLAVRIAWRARIGWAALDVNGALRGSHAEAPNVIVIEKGNAVSPFTLLALKKRWPNIPLVSFSEDDMFAGHNRSVQYLAGLRLYDLVVTTKSYNANANELPALGAKRVLFVNKSYEPTVHRPVTVTDAEREAIGGAVVFVGTFEAPRAASMLRLAEAGIAVRIWGNGWASYANRHPLLRVEGRPLYGEDYVRAIAATDVNLAFLRKMNRDLQTDRTMEIPACGAFMLAERTNEHLALFRDGEEAAFFASDDELIALVRRAIADPAWRKSVAAAARRRSVESGYSHDETLRRILETAVATRVSR
jgi:hypothetical protein